MERQRQLGYKSDNRKCLPKAKLFFFLLLLKKKEI